MKCKNCGDIDPYFKKEGENINYYCPDCKENLGTMFSIDLSDEEWESLKNRYGFKTGQDVSRFLHEIFDKIIKEK